MNTKQDLDKWITACISHYNKFAETKIPDTPIELQKMQLHIDKEYIHLTKEQLIHKCLYWESQVDKWFKKYYDNKETNSLTKIEYMKTIDERVEQLEQAHSRLFNLFNSFQKDFQNDKQVQLQQMEEIKNLLKQLEPKEEEIVALPETLLQGVEYKAIIHSIKSSKKVKWKNLDYKNWELKLIGKEEYIFIAFIPESIQLEVGDVVRFTYAHPHKLMKLRKPNI